MTDKVSKPIPATSAAANTAVKTVSAPAAPPRHDPVPALAVAAAPKPAASIAAKPAATVAAKPVAEPVKRKRGRPLGSKTVAKTVATKPAVAAKPITTKPIKAPTKTVTRPAAATSTKGPKTMTDTITKIQDSAKKFTGEAGARTQAMFGDMSTRAKGAYEKSVKLTEEFTEFQKGNVEALVESSKLAAKAAEKLGQEAADYARKSFDSTTAAFKTFASAKSPTELFKLQSDFMKSYFESAAAETSKVTEAWLKLAGDVAQPLSNRVAVAVEKVKANSAL